MPAGLPLLLPSSAWVALTSYSCFAALARIRATATRETEFALRAEHRGNELLEQSRRDAEQIVREAELKARDEAFRRREELTREIETARTELREQERRVEKREDAAEQKQKELARKEKHLDGLKEKTADRKEALEKKTKHLEELIEQETKKLHEITGLVARGRREDAPRAAGTGALRGDRREDPPARRAPQATGRESQPARSSPSRFSATRPITPPGMTVSTVDIPSDDMKGRIIGREGRNIRTFEKLTGVDVIVDDTPGVVIVSAFDNVRRETARLALTKLIQDGRIHPSRIEEVVAETQTEMEKHIMELGKQAVLDADVPMPHEKLIYLLGRLRFRTSYSQNVLAALGRSRAPLRADGRRTRARTPNWPAAAGCCTTSARRPITKWKADTRRSAPNWPSATARRARKCCTRSSATTTT